MEAQLIVGDKYNLGKGIGQDNASAIFWYRRSAEQGNNEVIDMLGRGMRLFGETSGNRLRSISLRIAASSPDLAGNPCALLSAGLAGFDRQLAPQPSRTVDRVAEHAFAHVRYVGKSSRAQGSLGAGRPTAAGANQRDGFVFPPLYGQGYSGDEPRHSLWIVNRDGLRARRHVGLALFGL